MAQRRHVHYIVFPDTTGAVVLCRYLNDTHCWLEVYEQEGSLTSKRSELGKLKGQSRPMNGDDLIFVYLQALKPEWSEKDLTFKGRSIDHHVSTLLLIRSEYTRRG